MIQKQQQQKQRCSGGVLPMTSLIAGHTQYLWRRLVAAHHAQAGGAQEPRVKSTHQNPARRQ